MKKSILLICICSLMLFGCEKESLVKNTGFESVMNPSSLQGITVQNGMLTFANEAALKALVVEFDRCYDLIDLQGHSTLNFNGTLEDPLKAFERQYDYISLRQSLGDMDVATDKSEDFWIHDEYAQTLLNAQLEIKIGKSIFKYLDAETMVEIVNGDLETLAEIRKDGSTVGRLRNVEVHYAPLSADCHSTDSESRTFYFENGNKRMICDLDLINLFNTQHRIKAKMRIQYKNGNNWVPFYTNLKILIGGQIYLGANTPCLYPQWIEWGNQYPVFDDRLTIRTTDFAEQLKVKKGSAGATYDCNGVKRSLNFNW